MSDVRSFSFEFQGKEYFAILRRRETAHGAEMHVRIMNHRLDTLLGKECNNSFSESEKTTGTDGPGKKDKQLSPVIYQHIRRLNSS